MSWQIRPFRTRLALRSAALTLLAVAALGALSLIGALLLGEQRETAQQYERLEELLNTVEQTVQVACFLDNRDLAGEVATGLLGNSIVARVQVLQGGGCVGRARPGAGADDDYATGAIGGVPIHA
ncbi:MAG: hypothetical protein R6V43_03165 [Halopseudomonas sp.]